MNQEIYLLKKKQRKELAKKRSLIDISILSDNFFYKKLIDYDWFNKGKIIGLFQGRMEWGPRALSSRSILASPKNKEINNFHFVRARCPQDY